MLDKTTKVTQNGISKKAMRIRVEFAKTEPMRHTSHLDLYRAWERLLRRAGFQLVFSQGYNPRPKLQLASPLPLGITSRGEIIDFWLSDCPDGVKSILTKLTKSQPPGIEVQQVEFVDPSSPTLQKKVTASEYLIDLLDEIPDLESRITSIMDLRPLIQEMSIHSIQHQTSQQIFMRLNAQEGGTGRPDEVLLALNIQPEDTLIERTKIIFLG